MANHDFEEAAQKAIDTKQSYRKELTQQSGSLVAQLATFKGKFDTLYAMASPAEQTALNIKFNEFKLDAKAALGL